MLHNLTFPFFYILIKLQNHEYQQSAVFLIPLINNLYTYVYQHFLYTTTNSFVAFVTLVNTHTHAHTHTHT